MRGLPFNIPDGFIHVALSVEGEVKCLLSISIPFDLPFPLMSQRYVKTQESQQ